MCVKRVPQKNRKSSAPVERNFFETTYGENKGKSFEIRRFRSFLGGDKRDRTADLLNAIQALSQLSYTPILAVSDSFRIIAVKGVFVKRFCELFSFFGAVPTDSYLSGRGRSMPRPGSLPHYPGRFRSPWRTAGRLLPGHHPKR